MDKKELEKLLERYLQDKCSDQEANLLDDFFESYKKEKHLYSFSSEDQDSLKLRIHNKIRQNIPPANSSFRKLYGVVTLQLATFIFVLFSSIATGFLAYRQWKDNSAIVWESKEVGFGQKSTIMLGDGTRVLLNSGSTIQFPKKFTGGERKVLLKGEAYFEVVRDSTRPFYISTGNLTTTVLGTSFNVNAYADEEVTVTVANGKVRVSENNHDANEVILEPGEQAIYNINEKGIKKDKVNIDQFFAWKNNTIQFEDIPLSSATDILERWYNVQIKFENPRLKLCTISGKYINENLINVLESIRFVKNINYRFDENNQIIFYGEACTQ